MEEDDFGYSPNVIDLLERIRINAVNLNHYHRKRYFYFKSYNKYFRIPIILLSILSGAFSVGLQALEVEQKVISGLTCLISLVIAMMSAIELHLSISDKLEDSYKFSKKYYALATDLYKTIKLSPAERSERGGDYLGRVFTEFSEMMRSSEMMKSKLKNDVLLRIPKELEETTPAGTPEVSIEDTREIYKKMAHNASFVFKPESPTMEKKYYQSLEDLREDIVRVTEVVAREDNDVESNLSK